MAILSDFFVASPEQATRYANRSGEPDGGAEITALLQPASYTGFTTLQIGMLWAILEGVAWDRKRLMLENIWFSDEGEAWLNRFPNKLMQLLADASADQLAAALVRWGRHGRGGLQRGRPRSCVERSWSTCQQSR